MLQDKETILALRRPAVFGRQPVVDGNEFGAGKIGDFSADRVMAFERADNETSAVEIEENG